MTVSNVQMVKYINGSLPTYNVDDCITMGKYV